MKSLALRNTALFSKESKLVNICGAIRRGYQKIDLSNTYSDPEPQKKQFTLKQLFTLTETLKTAKSQCQIMISFDELPTALQSIIPKAADSVNLTESVNIIYDLYRTKRFEEKISSITNPENSVINFESPLDKLTDEETRKLGEALQNSECSISKLILPLCNLSLLTPIIKNHSSLATINIAKLGFGVEVSDSLSEIFSSNSRIERLTCDYRLFLEPHSQKIIDSILTNSQSSLRSLKANDHKYIELIDSDQKLSNNPKALMDLINNVRKYPAHIKIIIELSVLSYDLQNALARKKLLPYPTNPYMSIQYSLDEEEKREKPLLYVNNSSKFILTPCYDTHEKIMNDVVAYLKKELEEQAAKTKEEAEQNIIEEKERKNTPSTSSTSSTSHASNARAENHSTPENATVIQQPFSNTNENQGDRHLITVEKNDLPPQIVPVPSQEKTGDSTNTDVPDNVTRDTGPSPSLQGSQLPWQSDKTTRLLQSDGENRGKQLPDGLVKLPTNLRIAVPSELTHSLNELSSLLQKDNEKNQAITKATQTLLDETLGQFVQSSNSNTPAIDQNKVTIAIATYRNAVANLSTAQQLFIAAMSFLGTLIGFIVGVLAGSLATGLNPVGALTGGATGAVAGGSIGGTAGGSIALGLSRFGVFQHDPIKAKARELVEAIEKLVLKPTLW